MDTVRRLLRCIHCEHTQNMNKFAIIVHPIKLANRDVSGEFCGRLSKDDASQVPWWLQSAVATDYQYVYYCMCILCNDMHACCYVPGI